MRTVLLALLAATICGCGIIYKLPTRQGNVLEQDEIDKLELGMTREQVRFVMGTPIAATTLQPDRWDYLGYYKNPRGKTYTRTVSLYFADNRLARMVGNERPADEKDAPEIKGSPGGQDTPAEDTREEPQSGVVITPE